MSGGERRPDPDAVLERVRAEEARGSRVRLRIILGYSPGVGKTYRMLEGARALRGEGVDLVVGFVETHGRSETAALLQGLEVLPRRSVEHRGTRLEEFDLEAALARKPSVLILDELAHTNAPGGRHEKRWQDALDLLEAGIEVHTTLNVQHLESLNDVVAQITWVRVRETVPDALLNRADEIELVDLPPEELLERLAQGKVYLPEEAARAKENFFRRGNLLALRELALRRAAERVDAEVRAYRRLHEIRTTWPASERILVCVGPSPSSARLVRTAYRMAAGLRAPWVAAYVEAVHREPISPASRERLEANLRLAESLGGSVARLPGGPVAESLLRYAREHNVSRIVVGKPTHPRLRDRLRGSLLDELVRGSGEIDVHVISGDPGAPEEDREDREAPRAGGASYGWATLLVGVATGLGVLARSSLALPDLAMVYVLAILVASVLFGRGPSVLASALSVAAYNFFFVPPYFTFAVAERRHLLTFATMFVVGLLISELSLRLRRGVRHAVAREEHTATLYALSRDLGAALDEEQISRVALRHAAEVFGGDAVLLLEDEAGALVPRASAARGFALDPHALGVARWALDHGRPAGVGTDTLPGAQVRCVPLQWGPRTFGVLALAPREGRPFGTEQRHFLDAFARQTALALDRARLAEEAKASALRARTEEMRSSLLSAVSHDLRTPLAAITGAATALRDQGAGLDAAQRGDLLDTVCEEAERLERLVGNLLDMTRLESGGLEVKREWVPLEEIVGAALARLGKRLSGRPIRTDLAGDLPLVPADPVLLEQVFVNLLENVARHTPPASPVEIFARNAGDQVEIEVADRGPGLPPGAESRLFEKFFRGPGAGPSGVGLGLSICQGIVQAHGGTIRASNRPGGGSTFRISLPVGTPPPPVPPDLQGSPGAETDIR
jgi:two-component system, OmpR family, sensor histidine kinase KdpD